jgi:YjbE family integral membrane protein
VGFTNTADLAFALAQIIIINVVLSGDNAVVIALACRNLAPRQQRQAFLIGTLGIVVFLTLLTAFAAYLLSLPYIEVAGSLVLLWIGVKLLVPEEGGDNIHQSDRLWDAIKTIVVADIVMSLDNVLGMAGAAKGHLGMLIVGLLVSIPLVLFGSALIMRLMERIPVLVTGGAALLGWVAGEMAVGDPSIEGWMRLEAPSLEYLVPLAGAAFVVVAGKYLERRAVLAEERNAVGEMAAE